MEEKILEELQKLYDNSRIGALIQEICEYFATKDNYEDGSYENEIEPPELTEAVYTLFCLQAREQILDEFSLVSRKYPALYERVRDFHQALLVNMDCRGLEQSAAETIARISAQTSDDLNSSTEPVGDVSDHSADGQVDDVPDHSADGQVSDVLDQMEMCIRTSDNLSEAVDKFYRYLHSGS